MTVKEIEAGAGNCSGLVLLCDKLDSGKTHAVTQSVCKTLCLFGTFHMSSNGRIKVHTREADVTRQVGTIEPFDRQFYDRVSCDTPSEITLWGLHVKLEWKRGYGKVVGILVDPADVPKLKAAVGFAPV